MDAATRAEFRDFVVARRHRLLCTAYLLAGDHERAERLVEVTLVRARRRWRRVAREEDPEMHTLRTLVAVYLSRVREWSARVQRAVGRAAPAWARTTSEAADGGDPGESGESAQPPGVTQQDLEADPVHDRMWRELEGLRPRARAILVLRYYEDLAVDEVADLLGYSLATVRKEEARGLDRLRGASREPQPRGAP